MNKEEAIEILKRKTQKTREGLEKKQYYGEQFALNEECQAIETVLNYISELEKHIKKFYKGEIHTCKQLKNIEENQKKYFINKQLILDKIEELDKNELLGKMNFEQVKFTIDILQEILKEKDNE